VPDEPPRTAPEPPPTQSRSVEPPTNSDIIASAVAAAGELAQVGLAVGEQLLRAAAKRLPKF
jgi:hypothetical protein